MEKLMNRYYISTAAYCFVRKIIELKDARVEKRISLETSQKVPMLWGDKVLVTLISTCSAPFIFPKHIINDLNQLHIYCQGLDPKDYDVKEKKDVFDFVYS